MGILYHFPFRTHTHNSLLILYSAWVLTNVINSTMYPIVTHQSFHNLSIKLILYTWYLLWTTPSISHYPKPIPNITATIVQDIIETIRQRHRNESWSLWMLVLLLTANMTTCIPMMIYFEEMMTLSIVKIGAGSNKEEDKSMWAVTYAKLPWLYFLAKNIGADNHHDPIVNHLFKLCTSFPFCNGLRHVLRMAHFLIIYVDFLYGKANLVPWIDLASCPCIGSMYQLYKWIDRNVVVIPLPRKTAG